MSVDRWYELEAMLTDRGRLSSDLVHDGYRVTVADARPDGSAFRFSLTRPTFDEACEAVIALVREELSR